MERTYFDLCYSRNAKIRWVCKFLKYTGFLEIDTMRGIVDEKLARIEKRRGQLDEDSVSQIAENLIWAKIVKRYLDRRLKPFMPKIGKDSPTLAFAENFPRSEFTYEMSSLTIYKEKHYRLRTNPSILFPGFLPDGNEAFFLLRKCFLKFGSVYYLNYPTKHFLKETIFHQVFDLIVQINNRKLKNAGKKCSPFLVGTSFGCHIIIKFVEWLKQNNLLDRLDIRGLILISPVLCQEDLVDPQLARQKTLVGRAFSHLMEVDESDPEAVRNAIQKAKSIFLKMFTSGRDLMKFEAKDLIPIFAIEDDVLGVFEKGLDEDDGYFLRFVELKKEGPMAQEFLTRIPTLVLFAEGEGDVLTPASPTFAAFSDIKQLQAIFPNGSVEFVYSKTTERKVTHSDLVFQANRFFEHLEPWLSRSVL